MLFTTNTDLSNIYDYVVFCYNGWWRIVHISSFLKQHIKSQTMVKLCKRNSNLMIFWGVKCSITGITLFFTIKGKHAPIQTLITEQMKQVVLRLPKKNTSKDGEVNEEAVNKICYHTININSCHITSSSFTPLPGMSRKQSNHRQVTINTNAPIVFSVKKAELSQTSDN